MSGGLDALAEQLGGAIGPRPVELWNPAHCGEIDIRILRDGGWLHEGRPIARPALVRLFASVLRKDPDGFYLVTPVEKLRIAVEDAPFLAIGVERRGEALRFVTNLGELVEAGPEHPLRVEAGAAGQPQPYLGVRGGLEARLNRPVFYELVELAQIVEGQATVRSNGMSFPLGDVEDKP